jgi:hypothetical protein
MSTVPSSSCKPEAACVARLQHLAEQLRNSGRDNLVLSRQPDALDVVLMLVGGIVPDASVGPKPANRDFPSCLAIRAYSLSRVEPAGVRKESHAFSVEGDSFGSDI